MEASTDESRWCLVVGGDTPARRVRETGSVPAALQPAQIAIRAGVQPSGRAHAIARGTRAVLAGLATIRAYRGPPTSSSYLVAGALTARLAERHSGRPSLTLAGIGVVLGTVGTVTQDVTPLWFSVALLVLGPPIVGVGGRMALRRSVRRRPVRRSAVPPQ